MPATSQSQSLGERLALLVAAGTFGAALASAQTPVDLSFLVNDDLTTYTNGGNYPQNGGPLTVAGVPFTLSTIAQKTFVIQSSSVQTFSIPVGRQGVTTVFTLINSAYGVCGTAVGELDFVGASSTTFVYALTEGTNVRDHNIPNNYCETVTS